MGRKTAGAPSHGSGGCRPQTWVLAGHAPHEGSGGSRHPQPSLALMASSPCLSYKNTSHMGWGARLLQDPLVLASRTCQHPISKSGPILKFWVGVNLGETLSNPLHSFLTPTQSIDSWGHPILSSKASLLHALPQTSLSCPARSRGRFSAVGASVLAHLDSPRTLHCMRPRASCNLGPVGGRWGRFRSPDRTGMAARTSLVRVHRTSWSYRLCGSGRVECWQFDVIGSHMPFGLWARDSNAQPPSLPISDAERQTWFGRGLEGWW